MTQLKAYTDEFIKTITTHDRYMGMMHSRLECFEPILSGQELCTKQKISELEDQVLQLHQLVYLTQKLNAQLQGMENPDERNLESWRNAAAVAIELRDKGVENLSLIAGWHVGRLTKIDHNIGNNHE